MTTHTDESTVAALAALDVEDLGLVIMALSAQVQLRKSDDEIAKRLWRMRNTFNQRQQFLAVGVTAEDSS